MIPSNLEYHRASSVNEAISLLEKNSQAKLLAGGHSLIPALKLRLDSPEHLIDIARISELKYIKDNGDTLSIGAATTHYMIQASDVVKSKTPLFAELAGTIGDVQVRNMGTIGGSIAHADPAADWPAALLAMDAAIIIQNNAGKRAIAAGDFFEDLFVTALKDEEIITAIRIPVQPDNTGSSYQKFAQPASRFALVGCAAMVTVINGVCIQVRVAFTGVGNTAFRDSSVEKALTGKSPDDANIEAAAANAAKGIDVLSDHFASEDYRQHLARVFAKRALTKAADNAG